VVDLRYEPPPRCATLGSVPTTVELRTPASVDAVCLAAIELARLGAVEFAGSVVGAHVGAEPEGERLLTHLFACTARGYLGWRWAVTVARAPRSKTVTICEVCLLPGPDALVAPEWLPWSERLRPGDLGVGDMLPTAPDDDRLVPAYLESDDPAVEETAVELGLGRLRVMSRLGRLEAAERWYDGTRGPAAPIARSAPAHCGTCGFYLPLAGSLRAAFGACGNEFAPDDAMVVSADHGCGAHSEALLEPSSTPLPGPAGDDDQIDVFAELMPAEPDDPDSESLGHS